jgi:hypothetical protein
MRYDVEVSGFPSAHAGHVCLLRLQEDDYPGTSTIEEWPSWTLPVLQWAKGQGGVVGYAHSGWGLEPVTPTDDLPNYVMPKMDGIGANEYIVTVTQDAVDFYSAGDTPAPWELNMWYHTLNTGFRTRLSGETDFPCIFDERVGLARSYARQEKNLDYDSYVEAIRNGRSYVSEGRSHIIDFFINNLELGTNGSEVSLESAQPVRITAKAAAYLLLNQNATGAQIASKKMDEQPYWHLERARVGQHVRFRLSLSSTESLWKHKKLSPTVVGMSYRSPILFSNQAGLHSGSIPVHIQILSLCLSMVSRYVPRSVVPSGAGARWINAGP